MGFAVFRLLRCARANLKPAQAEWSPLAESQSMCCTSAAAVFPVQVKRVDASVGYGGDWTVRVTATQREADSGDGDATKRVSLIFYVADEDVSGPSHSVCWLRFCGWQKHCRRVSQGEDGKARAQDCFHYRPSCRTSAALL